MDHVTNEILNFLKIHLKKGALLVGFSGGPDSTALLHLLLELKKIVSLELHLAHVDHGWREESSVEADLLRKKAEELGLDFHVKKLSLPQNGNREDVCRRERLDFFKELYAKFNCQALILGHHGDDLAETSLKRIFEGAHLANLGGFSSLSIFEGMVIWRPLLFLTKKEILSYLKEKNLSYLSDATNENNDFLRARMRQKLIPSLSEIFGKEIQSNLFHLSCRSFELKEYLDRKIAQALLKEEKGFLGSYFDFNLFCDMEKIEKRHLLKTLAFQQGIILSRVLLEQMLFWVESGKKNCSLRFKEKEVFIDRGVLFFLTPFPAFEEKIILKEGVFRIGSWEIRVEETSLKNTGHWKDFWKGSSFVTVSKGLYELALPKKGGSQQTFRKKLSSSAVPLFLRYSVPAIYKEGKVFSEFLSGKSPCNDFSENSFWKISLKILW